MQIFEFLHRDRILNYSLGSMVIEVAQKPGKNRPAHLSDPICILDLLEIMRSAFEEKVVTNHICRCESCWQTADCSRQFVQVVCSLCELDVSRMEARSMSGTVSKLEPTTVARINSTETPLRSGG